ncbi:hypothetical protein SAMN02745781_00505 [Vibrio gazogenes DSM 21264]|uniref:Uncharacterized protein n=1 Tax=Vibrio gazogenes DSM 21264 = NBRC 103151 TaxID=1123492 RepID=A0A1M4UMA3_VIBGA|nr:hypothetical protein SAMN02745781_00505 [Vibrio gazogenes DSM 21264] [Vibrio gazogenes DSM 21264 = NBRC 103151]SJN54348.1 hypothetical protein BQ6471_00965 [Vibrio gazogenes]
MKTTCSVLLYADIFNLDLNKNQTGSKHSYQEENIGSLAKITVWNNKLRTNEPIKLYDR